MCASVSNSYLSSFFQEKKYAAARSTLTVIIAVVALAAITVGILAIVASLPDTHYLGAINHMGWKAGAALATVGAIFLMGTIVIALVQRYCCSKKQEKASAAPSPEKTVPEPEKPILPIKDATHSAPDTKQEPEKSIPPVKDATQLAPDVMQAVEDELNKNWADPHAYKFTPLNTHLQILSIKIRDYVNAKMTIQHLQVIQEEDLFKTSWLPGKSFESLEELVNSVIAKEKWSVAILKAKNLTKGLSAPKALEMERKFQEQAPHSTKKLPRPLQLRSYYWGESFNAHSLSSTPVHAYTTNPMFLMQKWQDAQTVLPFEVWLGTQNKYRNVDYQPKKHFLSADSLPPDGEYIYVLDCHERFILITRTYDDTHHHSSMVEGGAVLCAGHMKIKNNTLVEFDDNSGHYRPPTENYAFALQSLIAQKIPIENSYQRSLEKKLNV